MVTEEEIRSKDFIDVLPEEVSMRITSGDVQRFEDNEAKLRKKIRDAKIKFDRDINNPSSSYKEFANMCFMDESTVKKTIAGTLKVTRHFLYKMAVGLKMTVEQANEYFVLCEGVLQENRLADYICIRALKDKDDMYTFIEEFEKFTKIKIYRGGCNKKIKWKENKGDNLS